MSFEPGSVSADRQAEFEVGEDADARPNRVAVVMQGVPLAPPRSTLCGTICFVDVRLSHLADLPRPGPLREL